MAATVGTPFRIGKKMLYLPDFTVTFLRTRHAPATTARFEVPLWFSKLDLRDYLFHAYNVKVFAVRSYVQQQPVQMDRPGASQPRPRRWHRPRAKKFMTVELERPFVWPEVPEDFSPWNKAEVEMSEKDTKEYQKLYSNTKDTVINEDRRMSIREQAQALLDGKVKWRAPSATI